MNGVPPDMAWRSPGNRAHVWARTQARVGMRAATKHAGGRAICSPHKRQTCPPCQGGNPSRSGNGRQAAGGARDRCGNRARALEIGSRGRRRRGKVDDGRQPAVQEQRRRVIPPGSAQPAVQHCGNAPPCWLACRAASSESRATTRGPLAVQMIVVAPAWPDPWPEDARAEDAINAWKTNRAIAASATHRLPALACARIGVPCYGKILARRWRRQSSPAARRLRIPPRPRVRARF